MFQGLLAAGEDLVTHNYVLVESMALIQHRLGLAAALKFAKDSEAFEIEWVDHDVHQEAVRLLARSGRRISFVDQVSFLVMRRRDVDAALAFDNGFESAGFHLYEG